jgi:hypothetical protein
MKRTTAAIAQQLIAIYLYLVQMLTRCTFQPIPVGEEWNAVVWGR